MSAEDDKKQLATFFDRHTRDVSDFFSAHNRLMNACAKETGAKKLQVGLSLGLIRGIIHETKLEKEQEVRLAQQLLEALKAER